MALALQINLTAQNAKTAPTPELMAEFKRVFRNESQEATEWAWDMWRRQSDFFPPIAAIVRLYAEWHRARREAAEAEKRRAEREAIEQARREGKLVDFVDVVKQMNEIVAAQPEPEHMKRQRAFNHRMQRAAHAVGTLHLSENEIEERRQKEQVEIRRYERGFS